MDTFFIRGAEVRALATEPAGFFQIKRPCGKASHGRKRQQVEFSGNFFDIAYTQVRIHFVRLFLSADFARDADGVLRRDIHLTEYMRGNVYGHGAAFILKNVSVLFRMPDDVSFQHTGGHFFGFDRILYGSVYLKGIARSDKTSVGRGGHEEKYGGGKDGYFHNFLRNGIDGRRTREPSGMPSYRVDGQRRDGSGPLAETAKDCGGTFRLEFMHTRQS